MSSAAAAIERLCDPKAEVSAHYVISLKGEVTQLVPENLRAWHAGVGEWHGQQDINSRSIGIELDNAGSHPFPEPQMAALEDLLRGIMTRWPISAKDVIGHSDMAPGRKIDPGARFDWARLARMDLAKAAGSEVGRASPTATLLRDVARNAGYTSNVEDDVLLAAVRLRFRPFATGPLAAADIAALGSGRNQI